MKLMHHRRRAASVLVAAVAVIGGSVGASAPAFAADTYTLTINVSGPPSGDSLSATLYCETTCSGAASYSANGSANQIVVTGVPADDYTLDVTDANGSFEGSSTDITISADQSTSVSLTPYFDCRTASTVTGTPAVGQVLTGHPGTIINGTPTSYRYYWYRYVNDGTTNNYTLVQGSDQPTYTAQPGDLGYRLEVDVSAFDASGDEVDCYGDTALTVPVGNAVVAAPKTFSFAALVGRPAGQHTVGKTLKAPSLSLPAGASVRYQWYRVTRVTGHGRVVTRAIAGAHGARYRLKKKDKGSKVFVQETASAAGYTTRTTRSGAVAVH